MSIAVVKNQINAFLATEKPEVIAIKGAWGVGKTYSWKQFLLAAKQSKEIALKRYSYVSLFGINSLDALKYAIFENDDSAAVLGIHFGTSLSQNACARRQPCLRRPGPSCVRSGALLRNAPLLPQ